MNEAADASKAEIHRKLAAALAGLVPDDPTIPPHPYLRRHLAEHAAQGHVLDDQHVPPNLLAWETSATVRRLLSTEEGPPARGQQWLQAWAKLEPFARDIGPVSRWASLQLAHHIATSGESARPQAAPDALAIGSPVTPLWSDCASADNVWAVTQAPVTAMTTCASADGRQVFIVTGDDLGVVRILRQDATAAAAPLSVHRGAVSHMLSLREGRVATASTDGTVSLVDARRGRFIRRIHQRAATWISSLTLYEPIPRVTVILVGHSDGHVAALDAVTYAHVDLVLPTFDPAAVLFQAVTLADRTSLLLYAQNRTVKCFDGLSVREHAPQPAPVRALRALPGSGGLYAVTDDDGNISIIDATTDSGAVRAHVRLRSTRATALGAVTMNDQPVLAAAVADGTVRLWTIPALKPVPVDVPGHSAPVSALVAARQGRHTRLLTAGADHTVRSWPLVAQPTTARRAWNPITASALSPTRPRRLASAEGTKTWIRNIESGERRALLDDEPVTALAWVPWHGRLLVAAATSDNSIALIDTDGPEATTVMELTGHCSPPLCLVPMADAAATVLASGSADGTVRLWDVNTGISLATFSDHMFSVRCLASTRTPGGFLLASGGSDGNLRVWDVQHRVQHGPTIRCGQNTVNDVGFFAAGHDVRDGIATAGQDGSLKLWSCGDPSEPLREFHPGSGELTAVTSYTNAFGRTIFVVAGMTSIHLWDPTTDRRLLQIVTGYPINTLKMAPDWRSENASPVLLATGEAGTMIVSLDDRHL